MARHRGRLAITAGALLLVVATIGCAGRGSASGSPAATEGLATASPGAAVAEPRSLQPATPIPSGGAATEPPVANPRTPPPSTPKPLATPDLTAIEQLLDDLDAALGDDADAGSEEGSPK